MPYERYSQMSIKISTTWINTRHKKANQKMPIGQTPDVHILKQIHIGSND